MNIVAYYRVSTKRQGESGLGLEAQQRAVEGYAKQVGGEIVGSYQEAESGKMSERPQLRMALAHAKDAGACLVVAKLDRLSRNVVFLGTVMESGVRFAAADMPSANEFMLHIMAAVAQHEARMISERTKAALAVAKARGTKLGSARPGHWDGREHLRVVALEKARAAKARKRSEAPSIYADLLPRMGLWKREGMSYGEIAVRLNEGGQTMKGGKRWTKLQVVRVMGSKFVD